MIVTWNANGLITRTLELDQYLCDGAIFMRSIGQPCPRYSEKKAPETKFGNTKLTAHYLLRNPEELYATR